MSARPSVICPRCGGADGVVASVDGDVVVRRCWCGHEFEVTAAEVPADPGLGSRVRAEALAEVEREAAALGEADNRSAFALGVLHVYVERAVEQLHLAGCVVASAELAEADEAAHRIAFGSALRVVA